VEQCANALINAHMRRAVEIVIQIDQQLAMAGCIKDKN
jgi:hypothetical protein